MTVSTNNTLYVLVTCSIEQTRADILQNVVDNILQQGFPIEDLLVIDNGSTFQSSKDLLRKTFKHVHLLKDNFGYWSAVHYGIMNRKMLGREYEYVYVIESDEIHYAANKLVECENVLDMNSAYGSVYTQEFSVDDIHLYDKTRPNKDSRTWAWKGLRSPKSGKRVVFETLCSIGDAHFYSSELAPQVCALNRTKFLDRAFENLSRLEIFNESHFWNEYFAEYDKTALLNGGMFHCKLVNEHSARAGSLISPQQVHIEGYRQTRTDQIRIITSDDVNIV